MKERGIKFFGEPKEMPWGKWHRLGFLPTAAVPTYFDSSHSRSHSFV